MKLLTPEAALALMLLRDTGDVGALPEDRPFIDVGYAELKPHRGIRITRKGAHALAEYFNRMKESQR